MNKIRIGQIYKTANKALLLHKGRTALTMLGVIIGVFAVVSLVSMGIGVQNYIQDQFDSFGANLVYVVPGNVSFERGGGDPAKLFGNNKLDEKHLDLIETELSDVILYPAPTIQTSKRINYKANSYLASMLASNYNFGELYNIELEEGRMFTKVEERGDSRVILIGPEVKDELFRNRSPIGLKVKIDNHQYEVIGVIKKKGPDFDNGAFLPYTTYKKDFTDTNFSSIGVKVKDPDQMDTVMKQIEITLLSDLEQDEFSVLSQEDIVSSIQNILSILTTAVGAIAGISLLVGGIGIMNIMLVSVTERIKEIGLRKALGATPKDIAYQFIIEAILISVGGGLIGLLFGWLASLGARSFVRTEVPLWAVVLAVGFSVLVGLVFGSYPAIKASKKDPIESLRYE